MSARTEIGRRLDNSYGIKAALPGFDVETALPHQLAFNSDWGAFGAVHLSGEIFCNSPDQYGYYGTVNFPILAFRPMVFTICTKDGLTMPRLWYGNWPGMQGQSNPPAGSESHVYPSLSIARDHFKVGGVQAVGVGFVNGFSVKYAVLAIRGEL